MQRSQALARLAEGPFDVAVVGGGVYGIAIAWKAAASGLRVALFERADFGSGTSSNSLRTIHGGLRYLQHVDLRRMRQSIRARREWLREFPDYVVPVQCAIPTFGHGIFGREVLALALLANDVISLDRNMGVGATQRLGLGRTCGRAGAQRLFADTAVRGYNGAALWYDGLCLNSERVLIGLLMRAMALGAVTLNHFGIERVVVAGKQVSGVVGTDSLTGHTHEVRAASVVNANGPWLDEVITRSGLVYASPMFRPSRAFNLLTRRLPFSTALGLPMRRERSDHDAVIDRRTDTFFVMPWGEYSLIGTRHLKQRPQSGPRLIDDDEIRAFLAELNGQLGSHALAERDVHGVFAGLLPESAASVDQPHVTLEKHGRIIDHAADGAQGLWSVFSVKWTTAMQTAAGVVARLRARHAALGRTLRSPSVAGESGEGARPPALRPRSLLGQVEQAVDQEMAVSLTDVVMRRTESYLDPSFDEAALADCAALMGRKLGWTTEQIASNMVAARKSCDQFRWGTRASSSAGAFDR